MKDNIVIKDTKDFTCNDLGELFLSLEWSSGRYPEKLKTAMQNSDAVYTAWDGNKLIGLISAMSDGVMNAYFQYLLVHPKYQGKGIGKKLVLQMLNNYKTYLRKSIIAYDNAVGFYKRCGFAVGEGVIPMSVTILNT